MTKDKTKPLQGLVNHNFENFLSIPEIKDKENFVNNHRDSFLSLVKSSTSERYRSLS